MNFWNIEKFINDICIDIVIILIRKKLEWGEGEQGLILKLFKAYQMIRIFIQNVPKIRVIVNIININNDHNVLYQSKC